MASGNGKPEVDPAELDPEHELPPADDARDGASATAQGSDLDKLKAERDNLLDRLARLQAEFENARKRTAREQQEFREYALAEAVKTLLPVLDSFERALQAGSAEKSELRSGIELIYKQLQDALQKLGLRTIPAKGEPFDPRLHEAVEMVET